MQIIELKNDSRGPLQRAADVLRSGGTVVFPAPTCYGIGAAVSREAGVRKLYKIKRRQAKKPLNIVVSCVAQFRKYGRYYRLIGSIQKKYPRELFTFIVPRADGVPRFLNPGMKKIGIIFARDGVHRKLVRLLGEPMVGTSANRSGCGECHDIPALLRQLGKGLSRPDLILDAGQLSARRPSTIVLIESETSFVVLRRGNERKITIP